MDAVAQALADPIRREILCMLRSQVATAGAIAKAFPVSRPAVSRHLRVLREAGLVQDRICGRERQYQVDLAPLTELEDYLRQLRGSSSPWQRRFDALATEVQRVRRRKRGSRPSRAARAAVAFKKESA